MQLPRSAAPRWIAALLIAAGCGFGSPILSDGGAGDGDDASQDRWWDPAWPARMQILIDNDAALEQGFQIGLRYELDAPPCAGSRDAVRVVRDHTSELPRVIDETGADEWIWFQLAARRPMMTGASEYWLYCGNPNAGQAPRDPANVFDLFEDFLGTALSSGWMSQGPAGSVMVAGDAVTLAGNNASIYSTAAFGTGRAIDFVLEVSSGARGNPLFWGGFGVEFVLGPPGAAWFSENANVIKQATQRVGQPNQTEANPMTTPTGLHLYGVEHHGSSAQFRYENAPAGTIDYGGTIADMMNIRFHNFQSGGSIRFHMTRVRKAVTPIPSVTLGAVENRP